MSILTHSTKTKHLDTILVEGLRLPEETGICNWKQYSEQDRISFLYQTNTLPFEKLVNIRTWDDCTYTVVLDPKFISQNVEQFKYYSCEFMAIGTYAEELKMKDANYKKNDILNEVVSFENIPVDAFHSLFIPPLSTQEINQIEKKVPKHMQIYHNFEHTNYHQRIR
jgi:hypothetical protein